MNEEVDNTASVAATSVWIGRAHSRPLQFAAVAAVIAGLVSAVVVPVADGGAPLSAGLVGLVPILLGPLIWLFSRITVMVDQRGLTVLYSMLSWPRTTVPLGDITSADTTTLRPREWLGWGYRMRSPRNVAVLLRGGDGLVVQTTRRRLAVTVDEPDGGVRLLRSLMEPSRS